MGNELICLFNKLSILGSGLVKASQWSDALCTNRDRAVWFLRYALFLG